MINVKNLSVEFGDYVAVNDVSFHASKGEWLMIVGPNGAGKSTIVNAISQGIDYHGSVLIDGADVRKMKSRERARKMGILTQSHYVGYGFTTEEVIRLGCYSYSRDSDSSRQSVEQRVMEAVSETGLEECLYRSVLTLSGGELQRAFLAQLFAQDPGILILDEPSNHLDLKYQKQIFETVDRWRIRKNRVIISVVHDLSMARRYGTHALLLKDGNTVKWGPISEVLTKNSLNTVYEMDVGAWMQGLLTEWTNDPNQ